MSALPAPALLDEIRRAAREHEMILPGAVVVVAASGGPDSTALLHGLWTLQSELGIRLIAAHMEHGIRGDESRADAEYVRRLCLDLDVPCRIEHVGVPEIAAERRVSKSTAARDARFEFLNRVARECCPAGKERIAIGHTSDDRAETILMNILRGAGAEGLSAMRAVRLPVIRPLLGVSREDTAAYCDRLRLAPRLDASNRQVEYRRNRVRMELLPHLAAYYNPCVKEALLRLAAVLEEEGSFLQASSRELLTSAARSLEANDKVIDARPLRSADPALLRRAIRITIGEVRGTTDDVSFECVDEVADAVRAASTYERTLPATSNGNVHVRVYGDTLRVWLASAPSEAEQWSVGLSVPGEAALPFNRRVDVDVMPAEYAFRTMQAYWFTNSAILLRRSETPDAFVLRSWRAGDRMKIKGISGTKKLQDLYTDCKVPRSARNLMAVLARSDNETDIIAVLGVRRGAGALTSAELEQMAAAEPDSEVVSVRLSTNDAQLVR